MQIDHNPNEKRPPKWFWWPIVLIFCALWIYSILRGDPGWGEVVFALATGVLLGMQIMEITGGVTPSSWRRKPPTRNR